MTTLDALKMDTGFRKASAAAQNRAWDAVWEGDPGFAALPRREQREVPPRPQAPGTHSQGLGFRPERCSRRPRKLRSLPGVWVPCAECGSSLFLQKELRERCAQCAAVSWGLTDEGKYYCTSCHNVTDRSKEVLNTEAIPHLKYKLSAGGLKGGKNMAFRFTHEQPNTLCRNWVRACDRDTDDGSALCQTACLCTGAVRALGKALPALTHRGRGGCLKRGVCLSERGWDWYVCEGFQHILCQQAEALKALGVGPNSSQALETPRWGEGVREHSQTRVLTGDTKGRTRREGAGVGRSPKESCGGALLGAAAQGTSDRVWPKRHRLLETQHRKLSTELLWARCASAFVIGTTIPLVSLPPQNQVLHNFWKRYLQKSRQAYCENPVYARKRKAAVLGSPSHSDWESEPALLSDASGPSWGESGAEPQADGRRRPSLSSRASQSEMASVCSGSLDGVEYSLRKEGLLKMTVPPPWLSAACRCCGSGGARPLRPPALFLFKNRFVEEGHIPYVNAFEHFPEEMKLYGRDKGIFAIERAASSDCPAMAVWRTFSTPCSVLVSSVRTGHFRSETLERSLTPATAAGFVSVVAQLRGHLPEMIEVATFLDLPRFPAITEDCYLHPNVLCRKYLMEVNLPDEMYDLTGQVVQMAGLGEADFLTFDPIAKQARAVKYDVQAAAVIVVVLKLLFLLDDRAEWSLSAIAETYNEENRGDKPCFDFRKWYHVMKKSFDEKKQKWEEARAKFMWKSEKPLYHSPIDRSVVYKRREMVVNLQKQFSTLADSVPAAARNSPSSFQFSWTGAAPGPACFHGHSLQGVLSRTGRSLTTLNSLYWLSTQRFCRSYCKHVTTYEESNFSLSYRFVIKLFSFLLRVKTYFLHEEVSLIEKRLFKTKYSKAKTKPSRSRKVRK
ncbi:hypothetical protein QTO34_006836 [Cnephaeus nilssonii]|uniref:TATA box-binding protein-associated factor RNA polymerase I subunit B n=1 Tax=Cnephaeus nilssonii TaxID=3371016 RepID=A0AA40HL95_CNENI|nr:hypothetical protein QTO34_006836 [Eptesicus nilssonii]